MILQIDTQSSQPIYEQLRNQIVIGIATKQLTPEEPLPSVRRLAADLGINLHTVNKVYTILCDEGYLVMDRRKGAVVSKVIPDDRVFIKKLTEKLLLISAEARCRKMKMEDFLELCQECFIKTSNSEEGME